MTDTSTDQKYMDRNLTALVEGFDLEDLNRIHDPLGRENMAVTYRLDLDGSPGKIRLCFLDSGLVQHESEVVLSDRSYLVGDVSLRQNEKGECLRLRTRLGWVELNDMPQRLRALLSA